MHSINRSIKDSTNLKRFATFFGNFSQHQWIPRIINNKMFQQHKSKDTAIL